MPSSIAFVSWKTGNRSGLAEVRLDVRGGERGAGPERGAEHVDEPGDAPGVVAEALGRGARRVAVAA